MVRWTGNRLSWFETTELDLARALAGEEEPVDDSWRRDGVQLASEPTAHAAGPGRDDRALGGELQKLVRFKPGSHYGSTFIGAEDRKRALRAAATLVDAATERTLGA